MPEQRKLLIAAIADGMKRFPDNVAIQRTSAAMLADFAHSGTASLVECVLNHA